jgi:hypothetical protein
MLSDHPVGRIGRNYGDGIPPIIIFPTASGEFDHQRTQSL